MKVEILFKDGVINEYDKIRSCSNASTKIAEDWFYAYKIGDLYGYPSIKIKMSEIVCIEVEG